MVLKLSNTVNLPRHQSGIFDHGDVYEANGWVYIAHPAHGSVEIFDGMKETYLKSISGCPEASGVVCAQEESMVFAASRGSGKILVINAAKGTLLRTVSAGSKPNGLAWDDSHGVLLAADVGDLCARLIDPWRGIVMRTVKLPGRPRWCKYSPKSGVFVICIRDTSGYMILSPKTGELGQLLRLSTHGPHGLDIDEKNNIAYFACDGGRVVALDIEEGVEVGSVKIPSEPDVTWFNPRKNFLYSALPKQGLIISIDTQKMSIVQQISTEEGSGSFAFDQGRQRLYSFQPKSCKAVAYFEV
jgi:DNA-binding beta-propeller fold protein YncE